MVHSEFTTSAVKQVTFNGIVVVEWPFQRSRGGNASIGHFLKLSLLLLELNMLLPLLLLLLLLVVVVHLLLLLQCCCWSHCFSVAAAAVALLLTAVFSTEGLLCSPS